MITLTWLQSVLQTILFHDRTKHVKLDPYYIKEKVESAIMNLIYTPIHLHVADILTKALSRIKFEGLKSKLGMDNIYSPV